MTSEDIVTISAGRQNNVLLDVRDLKMYFPVISGILFQRKIADCKAVDGVSFVIRQGETLGLVGESGCGKTTAGRCILMLHQPTAGGITFEGHELTTMKGGEIRRMRRRMQMIFQDPYASLNPRMTIGSIIGEPLVVHGLAGGRKERREKVQELMRVVGLNPYYVNRYPHEFSGGQRQRIGVARALAVQPSFIVCDEPISALDVSIQAQIINLLEELQAQFNLTYLFIAHDLSVVSHIADEVAVMYLGHIVERAASERVYNAPRHPYTWCLLSAIPTPDPGRRRTLVAMKEGEPPSPINPPSGCPFHPRCPKAFDRCPAEFPELLPLRGDPGHLVACHLYT